MILPKSRAPGVFHALAFVLFFSALRVLSAQEPVDGAAKRAAATLVRPGDQVVLRFLREPQLSGTINVSERGDVSFPKLGTIHVAQLTIAQLEDTLRSRYAEYLRSPEMDVSVLRRVVVNGEVKVPNVYLVDLSSTVRDAIARAGGITENGSSSRVAIVRDGKRISAKGWESTEGPAMDLISGDQVFIGRKAWIAINFLPAVSTAVVVVSLFISLKAIR